MQGITSKLTINVGGTLFTTTFDTITKIPYFDAFLKNATNTDMEIFVDRSPNLFCHILDHARGIRCSFPSTFESRVNLIDECDFYGLDSLMEEIELSFTKEELTRYQGLLQEPISLQDFEQQVAQLLEAKKALYLLIESVTLLPMGVNIGMPNDRLLEFQITMDTYCDTQCKSIDPSFDLKNLTDLKQSSVQHLVQTCKNLCTFIAWLSDCLQGLATSVFVQPLVRFTMASMFLCIVANTKSVHLLSTHVPSSSIRFALQLAATTIKDSDIFSGLK